MNHEGSDVDVVRVFAARTDDILIGKVPNSKFRYHMSDDEFKLRYHFSILKAHSFPDSEIDVTEWELGMFTHQLEKGNINAYWVIFSPHVTCDGWSWTTGAFDSLRKILEMNPTPGRIWRSVKGIAHNSLRTGATDKKKRMVMRTLFQFEHYVKTGEFRWDWDEVEFDIGAKIDELDEIVPQPEEQLDLSDWLLRVRKHEALA